jgi:Domain of unknown function (DUF4258)
MKNVIPFKQVKRKTGSNLSVHDALKMIRTLAQDSKNVLVVQHARDRHKKHGITRRQIDICLKKGVVSEGPFMNLHGSWQVNVSRLAAGEEITCTVAIEEEQRLIVVTVF